MDKMLTPIKAIRARCLNCACWQPKEVRLCADTKCSLYPYRMGRRPGKSMRSDKVAIIAEIGKAN